MGKNSIKNWKVWIVSIIVCIFLICTALYFAASSKQNSSQDTALTAGPDLTADPDIASTQGNNGKYRFLLKSSGGQNKTQQETRRDITGQDIDPEITIEMLSLDDMHDGGQYGDGGIVSITYRPLLERLELVPEKMETFRAFLSKRRMAWVEMNDELSNASELGDDTEALKNKLEDTAWEYEKLALELLGEENYQKYNQYNSSLGIFLTDTVDDLEKELEEGEEIDEPQKTQLTEAMADAFENFISSISPELRGPAGFIIEINDPDVIQIIVDHLDSLEEEYIASASTVLSESQMIKYQYVIQSKIDERRFFFQKTQKRNFLSGSDI